MRNPILLGTCVLLLCPPGLAAAQEPATSSGDTEADASSASSESTGDAEPSEAAAESAAGATEESPPSEEASDESAEAVSNVDRLNAANASELAEATEAAPETFTLGAYVEALYSWNFNEPSNGITHLRGFDNRHNTFTLANVAFDARWDWEDIVGRVTLQVGSTPATYYLAEPSLRGALGTNASDLTLWQFIQQAYVGYRIPVGTGLIVTAGLFLSPIGPEGMAVRDNWNWSRSNLFFGCPFYHTGVRLSYALDEHWAITLAGYNGWNTVLDDNDEKSIALQVTYADDLMALSLLYFTGVERPTGAPEGRAWRHLFDGHVTVHPTDWLSLLLHVNGGFEPNTFGTSGWLASALYARFRLLESPGLYIAARGDVFWETTPSNGMGTAGTIFWPSGGRPEQYVSSGTLTVELRPIDRVSFRAEYRHDHAGSPIFFGGAVSTDPTSNDFLFNRASQDTLTIGATTWF